MDQQPNYRRRRAIVVAAALALVAIGERDRAPTFGTVSIDFDRDRAPRVEATLAPPLDAVAAAVVFVVARIAG